jgi:hypothetical protein
LYRQEIPFCTVADTLLFEDCSKIHRVTWSPCSEWEKKGSNQSNPASATVQVSRPIRLKPSRTDYRTYLITKALTMGQPVPKESTDKPNKRYLSLLNLGS